MEFFGEGLSALTIADRATLGNMCPEYGATVAIFPIDDMTLDYLRLTGRDAARVQLVEAYAKAQGLFRTAGSPDAVYSQTIEINLDEHRAVPGGPEAAAGPRAAEQGEGGLRGGAAGMQVPAKGQDGDGRGRAPTAPSRGGRGGAGRRARSRRGGDRRDHQLHQHVEPERDDRRRPAGEEGGGEGPRHASRG